MSFMPATPFVSVTNQTAGKTLKKGIAYLLCACMLLPLTACDLTKKKPPEEQTEASTEDVVDSGYPLTVGDTTLNRRPTAVVSLASSLTEKLYDLELNDRLVGVSTFCEYPSAVMDLPQCGTAQIPNVNAIVNTGADLVFTSDQLKAMDTEALAAQGVQVVVLGGAASLAEVWASYTTIAQVMLGDTEGAQRAEEKTAAGKAWLTALRAEIPKAEASALYLKQLPFTVATGDTLEGELLTVLGLENIAGAYTGWSAPELDAAEGEANPVFEGLSVLFLDEKEISMEELKKNEIFSTLPVVTNENIIVVNSAALERQGLSMLEELYYMADSLWEDAEIPYWEREAAFADDATEPEEALPQDGTEAPKGEPESPKE